MADIVINPLILTLGLKAIELALYVALAACVQSGEPAPNLDRLALLSGVRRRVLPGAIKGLEGRGLIQVTRRGCKGNQYDLPSKSATFALFQNSATSAQFSPNNANGAQFEGDRIVRHSPQNSATFALPFPEKVRHSPFSALDDDESISPDPDPSDHQHQADLPTPEGWCSRAFELVGAEMGQIGLAQARRRDLYQLDAPRALALLYHARGEGKRPAALLSAMLRAGDDPGPAYVEQARLALDGPEGEPLFEEPEERGDSAEHDTPDSAPLPAESTASGGEPERGPEPPAPVGDGLDERIGSLTPLELWRSTLAQVARDMPDGYFGTWFGGCQVSAYANGVLTVRPRDSQAQVRLVKFQYLLETTLSRLAGTALRVQWFWPAPNGGAVEVADKLAVTKQEV